ncbi:MAG: RtcB family protein [Acidiferrobacterales bacterium]
MSIEIIKGKEGDDFRRVDIHLWTPAQEVESSALTQLRNITTLPYVAHHVAVMPDVHFGKGATVGSVIAMRGAVSPAAVGVDIGCGMGAVRTNLKAGDLPENLSQIRAAIEAEIPVGFNSHTRTQKSLELTKLFNEFKTLSPKVQDIEGKALLQIGTLGGGNHFIELCLDTEDNVWLMLHSGSRNIGKTLAEIHMSVAKHLEINKIIVDRDLSVFLAGTPEMAAYRNDLFWAQRYAFLNRETMFVIYQDIIKEFFPQAKFEKPILCHHNYVSEETHFGEELVVTRKGAIAAHKGTMGIIPGSMGAKSFIVRGLGNEESFCSASHGAGRRLSRGAAKRTFTLDDLAQQTAGIECRKDEGVLDEIPGAYKDIMQVMAYQKDLVEIVAELHQVLCVKG